MRSLTGRASPRGVLTAGSFAAATAALARPGFDTNSRVAVAVSGGGDSLALMALAAEAFPGRVQVLSLDHQLRRESAAECAVVAGLAASLGLPHATLVPAAAIGSANVQAEARAARYAALGGWCAAHAVPFLLTAHHADDQAETLLMRLARGSGLRGLGGIRPRRELEEGVTLLRPLLGFRRAELQAVVKKRGWVPLEDPSNQSQRFDRTHARMLLAETGWLNPDRLAASAAHLADAEAALAWAADLAFSSRTTNQQGALIANPEGLPAELQRRLLAKALAHFGTSEPDGPALARLQQRLVAGGSGTLGLVKAKALASGFWHFSPAAARTLPGQSSGTPVSE